MRASFEETRVASFCFSLGLQGADVERKTAGSNYTWTCYFSFYSGGVAGEGVKKKKKEKKKGNIRYTYIVRVYGCCIQFPIAHDAVRRTFFNL